MTELIREFWGFSSNFNLGMGFSPSTPRRLNIIIFSPVHYLNSKLNSLFFLHFSRKPIVVSYQMVGLAGTGQAPYLQVR